MRDAEAARVRARRIAREALAGEPAVGQFGDSADDGPPVGVCAQCGVTGGLMRMGSCCAPIDVCPACVAAMEAEARTLREEVIA